MHILISPRLHLYPALLAGFVLATSTASAASPCKGMQQNACMADSACGWVNGYTRKDGRAVASHCKLKGGRKGAQETRDGSARLSRAE